jgi:hypothetical protein
MKDTRYRSLTRAREYQICRVDVKRARFACQAAQRSRQINLSQPGRNRGLRPIELIN